MVMCHVYQFKSLTRAHPAAQINKFNYVTLIFYTVERLFREELNVCFVPKADIHILFYLIDKTLLQERFHPSH